VKSKEKRDQLDRDDSVFRTDFLDPICQDSVKGSWTLHKDITEGYSNLRNLRWPGYFCSHKAGTPTFTSFYLGDGKMNKDLPFMI
jgi:hypothetical protein